MLSYIRFKEVTLGTLGFKRLHQVSEVMLGYIKLHKDTLGYIRLH
jgi:hypothetical protein